MPRGLQRYYGQGDLHFLTFSCYKRMAFLRTQRARNLFVKELAKVREEGEVALHARQPGYARIGEASAGLAVEWLGVLRERRSVAGGN